MQWQEIKCEECFKYDLCMQYQLESSKDSLRSCQHAIDDTFCPNFSNAKVLEIGCGSREIGGRIKDIVESNGCQWVGIDIKETDLTTHVCSVTKMPFADNSFDWAIGCQTVEHWDKPRKALKELGRVLKPGAKLSLTAPIHLHGGKMFVRGDFNKIEKLFEKSPFDLELAQKWRMHHAELEEYTSEYQVKHLKRAGVKNTEGLSAYNIHCLMTNSRQQPKSLWAKLFGTNKQQLSAEAE
jgi:ubiquinone/menaquinone biosynthesis C-methylase UbiE